MLISTNGFGRSWGVGIKFNAVLDVKFSDALASGGGGAQILNSTTSGDTFQDNNLIGAVVYLLFLDGIQYTQVPIDVVFSSPIQKEFKLDALTGTITFAFTISGPVQLTTFYTSPGTVGVPGAEPVTLQEVKDYCKIDTGTLEDNILQDLIVTAREQCEDYTGISIVARTVTTLINNACGNIYLPYCPFISMLSVKNSDNEDVLTDSYELQGMYFPRVISPVECGLTFTYLAGYGIPPERIKTAIKQQVFFLYQNRGEDPMVYRAIESDITLSPMSKATLQRLRRV